MSNGGEENTPGRVKSDDFGRAVSRMAVAQICESAGFDGFKKSALDSLSDVTIQYLCDLGKTASFYANLSVPPGKHIQAWLPALPDPHTYLHTPMWNERLVDPRAETIEQARQRRKAERALLSLQKRLLSNGSAGASSSGISNNVKESGVIDSGQFLAMPSESGKKDVSPVVLSDKLKNHISVMQAFAPAIEAAKESGICDDGDFERKTLLEKRPAVIFKFKTGKKLLGESLDLSLSKKGGRSIGHWLGRDDERDDKKRRAEYILRQSMENPQELTQLSAAL
ncbi:transcription initiation factor TFIID subunit 8 isoform X2 [Populus alba x Populus x berolinensis]|uniref:Transcription initiation factor TFIID subunit 8 n=1 Tax=Populus alba x Populus x berolinensis TaxID=444605 RepID=A0AAD6LK61_9ROSI|nr:transcription initiation factor TFIID subunit 8 isoform X2 [Populus alba x Populus x berolinensis]